MTGSSQDAFVIVNEAAETPVDDALLARLVAARGAGRRLRLLRRREAELIALLRGICDERSRTARAASGCSSIVLETSGLADPGPIVEAIRADPMLVHHIVISEIVVAVDALHGLRSCAASRSAAGRSRPPTG